MGSVLRFQHILTPDGLERYKRLDIDDSGRIAAISDASGPEFDGWLALPGIPNAHSHCFQRAMVGLGEATVGDDSFWSWRDAMYRLAGAITPAEMAHIAARAFADMLSGGFTSVAEFHYLHHHPDGQAGVEMAEAVVEGADRAGIRLMLLPVYYRRGGFDSPPGERQRRFVHRSMDEYIALLESLGDVPVGIAPHSLRAVPAGEIAKLEAAAGMVLEEPFPRHIHIAEQRREVTECLDHFGGTPVQVLDEHVTLNRSWNLVHGTHASDAEIDLMAARGVTTVLCPLTEAYLGDGIFDAVRLTAAGGRLAIGSDSNVRIDAVEELRMLEYGQRLRRERRGCLADSEGLGRPLWTAAAAGGAVATGMPVGALKPGSFADLVVLDDASTVLGGLGGEAVLDALVTAGGAGDIAAVYVGGQPVVRSGRHRDAEAIARSFTSTMRQLRDRL